MPKHYCERQLRYINYKEVKLFAVTVLLRMAIGLRSVMAFCSFN